MKKYLFIPILMSACCFAMKVDKPASDRYVVLLTSGGDPIKMPMKCAKKLSIFAHILQDYDNENGMIIPLDRVDSGSILTLEELFCERKDKKISRTKHTIHRLEKAALAANYLGLEDKYLSKTIDPLMERLIHKDSLTKFAHGDLAIDSLEELRFPHLDSILKQLLQLYLPITPAIITEKYHLICRKGVESLLSEERGYTTTRILVGPPAYNDRLCKIMEDESVKSKLALSAGEKLLARWSDDSRITIWGIRDFDAFELLRTPNPIKKLDHMAWSPTRNQLAYSTDSTDESGKLAIFCGVKTRYIDSGSRMIYDFKWSPCGNYILVSHFYPEYYTSVFDSRTKDKLFIMKNPKKEICDVLGWSPDSSKIALKVDNVVDIIDWKTPSNFVSLQPSSENIIMKIEWSPSGNYMITFEGPNSRLLDTKSGESLGILDKFNHHITGLDPIVPEHSNRDFEWDEEHHTLIGKCPCNQLKWNLDQQIPLIKSIMSQPLKNILFCYYSLTYPERVLALLERKDSKLAPLFESMPEELKLRLEAVNSSTLGTVKKQFFKFF